MTTIYVVKGSHDPAKSGEWRDASTTIFWNAFYCASEERAQQKILDLLTTAEKSQSETGVEVATGTDTQGTKFFATKEGFGKSLITDTHPLGAYIRNIPNGDPNFPKRINSENAFYYKIEPLELR